MLSTISWSQYITIVSFALLIYYSFIGFKYYRWEILGLIGIRKVENEKVFIPADEGIQHFKPVENPENYLPKTMAEIDISPLVQAFDDEVQAFINSAEPNMPRPELLFSLHLIISKYPALKNADCRDEISTIAFTQINEKFPGLVKEAELLSIWT
jgi:hypothetical protein